MVKDTARPLQKMFMAVPPSYDFLNRLLTFRFDERWRRHAATAMLSGQPSKVLDLCTGTGDLALRLLKMAPARVSVTALDFSPPMLDVAQRKLLKRGLGNIKFIQGDVAALPFSNDAFDAIGIAFAFRNLTFKNPDTALFLSEILRVLNPGGRFVVVETTQPTNRILRSLVHFYLKYITVPLGAMISGHRGAYHYLAHSAINYYRADEVKELLLNAGFSKVTYRLFLNGVAGLWVCEKTSITHNP